jgi:tetratricopeptide (TPR) repeat protein
MRIRRVSPPVRYKEPRMFSFFANPRRRADRAFRKGFETGKYTSAVRLYRRVVDKDPSDYEALHNLGFIFLEVGDGAQAIEYLKKANAVHECSLHWNNLGRAYQQTRQFPEALEAYRNAVRLDEENVDPRYNSTVCLREMGKEQESLRELEMFLLDHPDHAGANNDRAIHHETSGEREKAVSSLRRALQSNPDYLASRLNIIRILCMMGRFPESTRHLEYLAEAGAQVRVEEKDGKVLVWINNSLLVEAERGG